jgi:glycosyltransferase involved in cell wall biosynthesis
MFSRPIREKTAMNVLFVSDHAPSSTNHSSSGTYKRMRTFIDALREKAAVRLLFYCRPDLVAAATNLLESEWALDTTEFTICPEDPDPELGGDLWKGYLARALSIHRQVGYVCTSGDSQLAAFERALDDRPDIIFAHRLPAMCPVFRTSRRLPRVFLDLDDIEHVRFLRSISQPPSWLLKRLGYLQVPALLWAERRAIKLTQKTFVCSEADERYLKTAWRLPNVGVIPNSIRVPDAQPFARAPVLLFLGTYAYKPNANAAEELITRIWPAVRAACPTATLILAGDQPERIPSFGRDVPGVQYTGFVPNLDKLYAEARIFCCPIRAGGGTRIKIIEAAAHGKPVVSTTIGAEGLHFADGREILLRDDATAFADACIRLLSDDQTSIALGEAARLKALAMYDRRSVMAHIQEEVLGTTAPI